MDSLMGLSRDGSCAIGVRPPGHALGFADTTTQGFDELTVWDFTARNRRFALRMKGKAMGAAVLAPSGKWAAAGNDHTPVLWWDISGQNPGDPVVVGGLVGCLGVSPDSTTLVVGDENGVVRLWDVATRSEQIQAQHGPAPLSCAAVSPDGKLIVTADEIGTIRFWQSGTLLPVGMLRGNVEVLSIAFFPDGRTLACGRHDGTIQVVDAVTFQERMTWQAHGAYVVSLAVTPDGGTLVSGTLSGPVRIWRTTNAPEAIARRASPTEGTSPTALPTVVWPTGKPY
jgi:WD40 repeat protein